MHQMKPFYRLGFVLIAASLLCSCGYQATQSSSTISTYTPLISTTPLSPTFTASPYPPGTLTPQSPPVLSTSHANEQLYIYPEGWYSVRIPADWQAMDHPNKFSGIDGFFETEYLPEMMFIDQDVDICQWIANISTRNTYSMSFVGSIGDSCKLYTLPGVKPASEMEVIINPSADILHRVLYLKADPDHFPKIASTFTWLQPVAEQGDLKYQEASLRAADLSFWDNTAPPPSGMTITEYELPAKAQAASPAEEIFLDYVPPEALPVTEKTNRIYTPETTENINVEITPFGYELRTGSESYLFNLYKDGNLVIRNITKLPDVHISNSSAGEKLAFIVHTIKDLEKSFYESGNAASYLVQKDSVTLWEDKPPNPMFSEGRSIWAGEDLLILGLGDGTDLQVRGADHDLLFSFETYFGAQIPFKQYQAWDGHWILGVSSFIIQDGQILNETFGFEEVFNWYLIEGKPLYFFRKGPRAGISYDGQFLQNYYHEIIQGYCCGLALNNPWRYENTVRFFGRRDGIWYFVVMEIK